VRGCVQAVDVGQLDVYVYQLHDSHEEIEQLDTDDEVIAASHWLLPCTHQPHNSSHNRQGFVTIFSHIGLSVWNAHTHTRPFNGPLSRTTQVSRYQKGKTNLDFTEARDSEWHWHQLGHMQVCTSFQTDNHTSTCLKMSVITPTALFTSLLKKYIYVLH